MKRQSHRTEQGQALVEFALLSIVLFMLIFVVVEGAHLFQAQLTVQNAARAAGRYAVTGRYDETICDSAPSPCDVRLASIRAVAEEALTGLRLDSGAGFLEPAFYEIQVFGTSASGNLIADNAGVAGRPVVIRVLYRAEVITPLLRPIAETVLVSGQTVMNNESPATRRTGSSGNAPAVPALPPVAPTPTVQPPGPPDLYVSKSGPGRVLINSTFQYRLEVGNIGEQEATDVVLSDTLTGGGVIVSASPVCGPGTTSVACNVGTLAPAASTVVTVAVQAGPSAMTLTNTATVTGTIAEAPGALTNNVSQVQTQVVDDASTDLRLTKTGPPVDVWAESTVVFYLTVENLGLLPAVQFRVVDTLPPGMTYVGSDDNCWSVPPENGREVVLCGAATLAPGASTTFAVRATAPVAVGSYTNQARIVMDPALVDSNPDNDFADFTFNVVRTSDLWITKVGAPATLNAGERLTYTLEVGNLGPSTATNVTIDDILPSSVAFVSATFDAPTGGGACKRGGDVVTCHIGALEVNQTATATIVVVPQQGGALINSAQVRSVETDTDMRNNSAVASSKITLLADLSIDKTATPFEGRVGQKLTYELTVTNKGPSTATGVIVEDPLTGDADRRGHELGDLQFHDVTASQGYCEFRDGTVRCLLGRMAAGQTATVVIRVIPQSITGDGKPYINEAFVYGNERDDVPNNNSSAPTAVVTGEPAVHLQPDCGPAGSSENPTLVRILGYNFRSTGSEDIALTWRNAGGATILQTLTSESRKSSFARDWAIPAGTPDGTYRLYAVQNAQGGDSERSAYAEFKIPCEGPDLAVGPIQHTASATQGAPATFTVNITNTGSTNASSLFYVSLYFDPIAASELSATGHISSTYRQDVVAVNGLNAGASATVTFAVENLGAPAGTLPVYVVVDSDPAPEGAIPEINELNNVAATTLLVLAGDSFSPPTGSTALTGRTHVRSEAAPSYVVQQYVQVTVFGGSDWLATTFSDGSGTYHFGDLPELPTGERYTITACFVQNGASYSAILTGQSPPASGLWTRDLELVEGPCS